METKIIYTSILLCAIFLAGDAYAVGQGGGTGSVMGVQNQQQIQAINQGEANQLEVQMEAQGGVGVGVASGSQAQTPAQSAEQLKGGSVPQDTGSGAQDQVREQDRQQLKDGSGIGDQERMQERDRQELHDGSGTGTQEQGQNQSQIQNQANGAPKGGGNQIAGQRRSIVAGAVQQMMQVADRNGGIGEQVRVIAQTQTQNQEKIEISLQKAESRGEFAKFLIGPNYGEINSAQKMLEQNRQQIQQLNQIKNQLENEGDQQLLTQQIQLLEQVNSQIQVSLDESRKGFSLFGWLFKMFNK